MLAISVYDVTDDLYSEYEADVHKEHKDFVSLEPDSQKVNVKDFHGIFHVELQGVNNMLICPISSPYLSGPWSWTECQCHNDHALVVCNPVDGGVRLSGFVLAGFIGTENAHLPYFEGPWTDYECHSETTSNY